MEEDLDIYYQYENILQRMLDSITNDIDKREGSIIYNALAPAAIELSQMYFILKNNMDLCFADTAVGEYLDRLCEQVGIKRRQAIKAVRGAQFFTNIIDEIDGSYLPYEDIPIGSRFSIENIPYTIIEKVDASENELGLTNIYKLECEIPGIIGNQYSGRLVPIDNIENLGMTDLSAIVIPGQDEETDEELRIRYFEFVAQTPFGGNISDYKQKVKEIKGIGPVYVTTGDNLLYYDENVRITILNSNLNKADEKLINDVQEIIDPTMDGSGIGIAPIRTQSQSKNSR